MNFCERPARVDRRPDSCLIDFWIQRADAQKLLLIESRYDLATQDVEGLAVDVVPLAELAAARMWISNWARMLPVISATRSLVPRSLSKALLGRVVEPQPLARLIAGLMRSQHQGKRPVFKYCVRCLSSGYHGVIHQAEGRRVCPVHGCAMHEVCRHCRRAFSFWLDAGLLDAPFRCPSCRGYLASPTSVRFAEHKRFGCRERAAITRSVLA